MKKARSLLYGKLYGESDAAIIFFNFNRLATGIWDLKSQSQKSKKKIVNKYRFIVFKMTAKNTQTAIGRRNMRKTFQNHPTKPNRLILKVFFFFGSPPWLWDFKSQIPVARWLKLKKIIAASDSPYNFPYKSDLAFFICSLFYFKVLYNPL